MARKHVATGRKPPGGKRPGAGRKPGTKNALPLGSVAAVKSLRLRVPESTPAPLAEVADEAFGTIVDVMRGKVLDPSMAQVRIRAASMAREEICGPVKQRVEVNFAELTDEQLERRYREIVAAGATSATKPPESGE